MTFWIGIEEGIEPHPYIHELHRPNEPLVLAQTQNPALTRASFVWTNASKESWAALSPEFATIVENVPGMGARPSFLLAWRVPGYRARLSEYFVTKRQRQGWAGGVFDDVAVVTRSYAETPRRGLRPVTLDEFSEGGLALLWSQASPGELVQSALRPSLEYLGRFGELALTPESYGWLASSHSTIGYLTRDPCTRPALVIVGPKGELRDWVARGFGLDRSAIAAQCFGAEAPNVWAHAPGRCE